MGNEQVSCCGSAPKEKPNEQKTCCGSSKSAEPVVSSHEWVTGHVDTPAGNVPLVSTTLSKADKRGTRAARWSDKRMTYQIEPGLYGVGKPTRESPVLASANYKMSFDRLRMELGDLDAWILVLDTKGINVWCAAGKGTFGTEELNHRIKTAELESIVSHKKIILPQLGAPGVAAHEVKKETGFKMIYGPVHAKDIPAFLESGLKKTPEMRKMEFPLKERMVLVPIELRFGVKWFSLVFLLLLVFNVFQGWPEPSVILLGTLYEILIFTGAILVGTVLFPMLLPWVPFRSFALKGWILGTIFAAITAHFFAPTLLLKITYLLMMPPISSYLAVNFTGTSTYTSLSGVVKELKYALPLLIISAALGIILRITILF